MEPAPAQRSSPDRRTLVLADTSAVPAAVGAASAVGWHLASASRTPRGVEIVLRR